MRAATISYPALCLALAVASIGCKSIPPATPNAPFADQATPTRPAEPRERRTRSSKTDGPAQPGDFDFYLLTLSWSPEFCATHPTSSECTADPGFVVHGLWPQNNDGTYPEHCGDAPGPANPQSDTDILPTASLVQHEWQTHGTCSGLDATTYFNNIRQAFHSIKLPSDIGHGAPSQLVAPSAILDEFKAANPSFPADSFALSCGNNRLTAVEVCLAKDLRPEACQGIRTCRAAVIRVTPQ